MKATGIILAGGKSLRFQGNKAFAILASKRLIDHVVGAIETSCQQIILVSNTPEQYQDLGLKIVSDLVPGHGPLSGIHAGLHASHFNINFVVACDMPFIRKDMVAYLIAKTMPNDHIVVPIIKGYPEPLCAVYCKTCLPVIDVKLREGIRKVKEVYKFLNVRYIPENELEPYGGKQNFININTKSDLDKALKMNKN